MTSKQIIGFVAIIVVIILCVLISPPKTKWRERELIVSKGETLWSISKRFCPETEDRRKWIHKVKKLNNTNGNIKEGQVLIILEVEKNEENNFKTRR